MGAQGIWELCTLCSVFLWIETTLKGKVYFKKKWHERQRQKPSLKKKAKNTSSQKVTVTKGTKEYSKQRNVQSFKETLLRQYWRYEKVEWNPRFMNGNAYLQSANLSNDL